MSKTVFILGAGASKRAGAPLMGEFLDTADQLWKSGQVEEDKEHFERVFKQIGRLQAVHSKSQLDLINIESVFATLEMAKVLNQIPGGEVDKIDDCLKSIRRLIVRTLEKTIELRVMPDNRILPPKPYDGFISLLNFLRVDSIPRHSVSVLTFNYDMALDYAFHFNNIAADYALEEVEIRNKIPLLKLHGSLNWGLCEECKRIIPWYLGDFYSRYDYRLHLLHKGNLELNIGTLLKNFEHCGQKSMTEPVLVPPTWNKTEHHTVLSLVWQRAAKELSEAENIFVIGYSLPESDAFFRQLYALGTVGEFPLQKFWVFDPDKTGDVDARFRKLIGHGAESRFKKYDLRFDQSIEIIGQAFGAKNTEVWRRG